MQGNFYMISIPSDQSFNAHNPFAHPRVIRRMVLNNVAVTPKLKFNGKGFICALITSRCPVGCDHCMFFANMEEDKNQFNTMTPDRVNKLIKLVGDSNTGYLLVSGGGEVFLEPELIYQIVEKSPASLTWIVTSAFWAKKKSTAIKVIEEMYQAFLRGNIRKHNRRVCLRISIDSWHVKKLAKNTNDPFNYIVNIIKIFESTYSHQRDFFLQLHALKGDEHLIEQLRQRIKAIEMPSLSPIHWQEKATESAIALLMPSGYNFEVTFAKLLYSDIAADLRDLDLLEKRIDIWEKDAYVNERGRPGCLINADGSIGSNMLVIYDGRVAGGWQCEMPDVSINIDEDSYEN